MLYTAKATFRRSWNFHTGLNFRRAAQQLRHSSSQRGGMPRCRSGREDRPHENHVKKRFAALPDD